MVCIIIDGMAGLLGSGQAQATRTKAPHHGRGHFNGRDVGEYNRVARAYCRCGANPAAADLSHVALGQGTAIKEIMGH